MKPTDIRWMFRKNWVFGIYNYKIGGTNVPYLLSAALISLSIFVVGAVGALLNSALREYLTAISPYLHLTGVFLVFVSFDWFIKRLTHILCLLEDVFNTNPKSYKRAIQKMVDAIASRNIYMIPAGSIFAVLNIVEINAIWTSPTPPILLANWVNSPAQLYFRIFYTFVHGLVVPFLLGSGVIGLIGYIGLIHKLFQFPLKLKNYQTTSHVIEWTTGLVMWTLMALGLILTLARPIVFFKSGIQEILLSGGIQAFIAFVLAILVAVIPLRAVYRAITKAKREELDDWHGLRLEIASSLKTILNSKYVSSVKKPKQPGADADPFVSEEIIDKKLERITRDIASIDAEINRINDIPGLPIRWPSILRVGVGTVFSVAFPLLKDLLLLQLPN